MSGTAIFEGLCKSNPNNMKITLYKNYYQEMTQRFAKNMHFRSKC